MLGGGGTKLSCQPGWGEGGAKGGRGEAGFPRPWGWGTGAQGRGSLMGLASRAIVTIADFCVRSRQASPEGAPAVPLILTAGLGEHFPQSPSWIPDAQRRSHWPKQHSFKLQEPCSPQTSDSRLLTTCSSRNSPPGPGATSQRSRRQRRPQEVKGLSKVT